MKLFYLFLVSIILLSGCADPNSTAKKTSPPDPVPTILENGESSHITVQHCLIGFVGSVPGKDIFRKQEDAAELAATVLEKAKAGEDFDDLIKEYTDDSPPGIYNMANTGIEGYQDPKNDLRKTIFERGGMVPAFGDVGFKLEVGEFGMGEYDPVKSKYGWHIIKRIK